MSARATPRRCWRSYSLTPVTERDSSRKLLPLKFSPKSSSVFSSSPCPPPLCPGLVSHQLPGAAKPLSCPGCWVCLEMIVPFTGAFGDPGLTQGAAIMGMLQERRAEQRPVAPCPHLLSLCPRGWPSARPMPPSQKQRARWPRVPRAPKPSLEDRAWSLEEAGTVHICAPQTAGAHPIFPACAEGGGGGAFLVHATPLRPSLSLFHEVRSTVPRGCLARARGLGCALHTSRHLTNAVGAVGDLVPSGVLVSTGRVYSEQLILVVLQLSWAPHQPCPPSAYIL